MSPPRPPSPFPPINRHILAAGTVLHRSHARAFRPAQFNPCQGQPTRFAPFHDRAGACVPTLYAATSYVQTARWAHAIHAAATDIDGLIWTSRQCDPERCVVLFEDRIAEDGFQVLECRHVGSDAALLLELRDYGRRAGITIVS